VKDCDVHKFRQVDSATLFNFIFSLENGQACLVFLTLFHEIFILRYGSSHNDALRV